MPEIERKYRLTRVPSDLGPGSPLRQAYVALDGDVEVRVRSDGTRHVITVKGGRGMERAEVETEISGDDFAELWPLAGDRQLEKTRHRVDVGDGLVAEVDVYGGGLAGLAVVEVEFPSREAAAAFAPPDWFGPDVTGEPGWSNAELATQGMPQRPRR
jgi:adenylate cyclase